MLYKKFGDKISNSFLNRLHQKAEKLAWHVLPTPATDKKEKGEKQNKKQSNFYLHKREEEENTAQIIKQKKKEKHNGI